VYEETGFDISSFIVESDFVETVQSQQRTKLFIVAEIDEQVLHFGACWLRDVASAYSCGRLCALHPRPDRVRAADAQGDQQHRVALGR
jgi:hypothetical protein